MSLTDQKVLADFAHDALYFKILDPAKVVAWADTLIAETDFPPPWMLDLSLVKQSDTLAVHAALKAVPGTPNPDESASLLNALILRTWKSGQLNIGSIRGIGWQIYLTDFDPRDMSRWGVVVECYGEDLDDGRITKSKMCEIIDNELARFEPLLPLLPPWV